MRPGVVLFALFKKEVLKVLLLSTYWSGKVNLMMLFFVFTSECEGGNFGGGAQQFKTTFLFEIKATRQDAQKHFEVLSAYTPHNFTVVHRNRDLRRCV